MCLKTTAIKMYIIFMGKLIMRGRERHSLASILVLMKTNERGQSYKLSHLIYSSCTWTQKIITASVTWMHLHLEQTYQ